MTRAGGFTLIEVAIVTVVLTLLLGGLLIPLAAQVDQRRYAETRKSLEEIKDALIGFAQVNGRLPCPAGPDGIARTPNCDSIYEDDLPWRTLGVAPADAWGQRFRYAVAHSLVQPPSPDKLSYSTVTDLQILYDSRDGINHKLADNVAAVVFSRGKNGAAPTPAENVDEAENMSPDKVFVSRTPTDGAAGCSDSTTGAAFCEFDDAVTWVSPFVLFPRMADAGQMVP